MTQKAIRLVCHGCNAPFRAKSKVHQLNVVAMATNSGWLLPTTATTDVLDKKQLAGIECYCRTCAMKGRLLSNGGDTIADSGRQSATSVAETSTPIQPA